MTNNINKVTLKPFYVPTEGLSPQKGQDLLDLAITAGANACEFVEGSNAANSLFSARGYPITGYNYIGVDYENDTLLADGGFFVEGATQNILTHSEALTYLNGLINPISTTVKTITECTKVASKRGKPVVQEGQLKTIADCKGLLDKTRATLEIKFNNDLMWYTVIVNSNRYIVHSEDKVYKVLEQVLQMREAQNTIDKLTV